MEQEGAELDTAQLVCPESWQKQTMAEGSRSEQFRAPELQGLRNFKSIFQLGKTHVDFFSSFSPETWEIYPIDYLGTQITLQIWIFNESSFAHTKFETFSEIFHPVLFLVEMFIVNH